MKSENNTENKKNKKSKLIIIILIVLIIGIGAFFGIRLYKDYLARKRAEDLSQNYVETTDDRVVNPVDFDALKKRNSEVYAWIVVPNTDIELPILQSHADDLYYLDRDIDGKKSRLGSIFTQSANKRDFSDPVTVIYGHNYYTGGMFTNLHYFENKDFFDKNEYFYIYTPDRRLTYYIVSAYKYDERHILNSFDFSEESVRREYFDYTLDPRSMLRNVREGAVLSTDDKLVVLSTCLTGGYSGRYLVSGVLVNDEQTK